MINKLMNVCVRAADSLGWLCFIDNDVVNSYDAMYAYNRSVGIIKISHYTMCKFITDAEYFKSLLQLEHNRSNVSCKPSLLATIDLSHYIKKYSRKKTSVFIDELAENTRDVDIVGWYRENRTIGIVFFEAGENNLPVVFNKVDSLIKRCYTVEEEFAIKTGFYLMSGENSDSGRNLPNTLLSNSLS